MRNQTNGKLTRFGLKIIPNTSSGEAADMAETFAEEIEREYTISGLSVSKGNSYSDFATNGKANLDDDYYMEPEIGEVEIYPHHFQVSYKNYFSGADGAPSAGIEAADATSLWMTTRWFSSPSARVRRIS
ncbi:MAG: hypothetical protein V8Q79_08190 [Christensenellales bacterium]